MSNISKAKQAQITSSFVARYTRETSKDIPILKAFTQEIRQHANPEKMIHYLFGTHDF